jgi:hypothetical protein
MREIEHGALATPLPTLIREQLQLVNCWIFRDLQEEMRGNSAQGLVGAMNQIERSG